MIDCFASTLFFTVFGSKELGDLVFMRLIWENILSTAAEECDKTVIVVIKYDNRENFKLCRTSFTKPKLSQYSGTHLAKTASCFAEIRKVLR